MVQDCAAKDASELNRHGVPDLSRHGREIAVEYETHWKSLYARSFANTDCAVLCGMPKATIRKANATGSQSGSWLILEHSAINVGMS